MEETFRVGYALAQQKQSDFIQDSLINLAKQKHIDLIKIDPTLSLLHQGPLDCLLHKIYDPDWSHQLHDYSLKNPNVLIIDPPHAIERVRNRISMLEVIKEFNTEWLHDNTVSFGVPKQFTIDDAKMVFELEIGMKFPVIAKPVMADGSEESHEMCLVINNECLNKLKPPIILQEFVNHGGVLFKVYVVGEHVKCVKRNSLPDITEEKLRNLVEESGDSSLWFSQVSSLYDCNEEEKDCEMMVGLKGVSEMPPEDFIDEMSMRLKKAMGLNLFNFDVIREGGVGNRYLVIDINYFPGYVKMPGYEIVLTEFLLDVWRKKRDQGF